MLINLSKLGARINGLHRKKMRSFKNLSGTCVNGVEVSNDLLLLFFRFLQKSGKHLSFEALLDQDGYSGCRF